MGTKMKASDFLNKDHQKLIIQAIEVAEKDTSGEIRIHIESHCNGDVLDRAAYLFAKLKMHKTQSRNGVLIYLALNDKKFAILGDGGINAKVPADFWDTIKKAMAQKFSEGKFTEGLIVGITTSGAKLKEFFPYQSDDVNELSNEISFGK
jgi:uncharacterized membrane protein